MVSKSDMTSIRLIEAILFIAERPVSVEEIKQKLNIKEDKDFNHYIQILRERLQQRKSFIQISEFEEGRSIQMGLDSEVKRGLDAFRTKKAIPKELMGTLAYIALRQPVKYSDLRKIRGSQVKEHVEQLEKEGYIKMEAIERTKVITTTLYFASVFDLDPDNIKDTFKREIKKRMKKMIE